jgi:hypothetical protein
MIMEKDEMALRWDFISGSPQLALMLGTKKDPNDKTVDWVTENNRLIDKLRSNYGET